MANKKRKKHVGKPGGSAKVIGLGVNKAEQEAAGERVTRVIQQMLKPPESVIAHLTRVGAPHWVAPFAIDAEGKPYHRPCLVVPYDDLVSSELAHISAGGEMSTTYSADIKKQGADAARRVVAMSTQKGSKDYVASEQTLQEMQRMTGAFSEFRHSLKDVAETVQKDYEDLAREQTEAAKPDVEVVQESAVAVFNGEIIEADDDDEWPIIGESLG